MYASSGKRNFIAYPISVLIRKTAVGERKLV
jgi:hypothetical protein